MLFEVGDLPLVLAGEALASELTVDAHEAEWTVARVRVGVRLAAVLADADHDSPRSNARPMRIAESMQNVQKPRM